MNKRFHILLVMIWGLSFTSCSKEKKVSIETHFWVPNSFSPNGDSIDEQFVILPSYGTDVPEFHISIYDQNLHLVFESNDINNSWDGKLQHEDAPEGYYEYQILYTASTDSVNYEDYITSSKINLMRSY